MLNFDCTYLVGCFVAFTTSIVSGRIVPVEPNLNARDGNRPATVVATAGLGEAVGPESRVALRLLSVASAAAQLRLPGRVIQAVSAVVARARQHPQARGPGLPGFKSSRGSACQWARPPRRLMTETRMVIGNLTLAVPGDDWPGPWRGEPAPDSEPPPGRAPRRPGSGAAGPRATGSARQARFPY